MKNMKLTERARFAASASWRAVDVARERMRLSCGGLVAVMAGLVALLITTAGLAGVAEDVTRHNGLATADARDLSIVTDHRSAPLVTAAHAITNLGAVAVVGAVAVIAGYVLWRRGARFGLAIAPAVSLGAAGVAAAIGKTVVGRSRPPVGVRLVNETAPSFPSGHATDATALYLALALVAAIVVFRKPIARMLVVVGAGLLAGIIGLSRLELGVHWPTDVMAGWALGATIALAVTITAAVASDLGAAGAGSKTPPMLRLLAARRTPARRWR
jgi:membrane-associated phospholipid phosphatase